MYSFRKLTVSPIRLINPLIRLNCIRTRDLCTAKETTSENERTASFGFQTVRESEKEDKGIDSKFLRNQIVFVLNAMRSLI